LENKRPEREGREDLIDGKLKKRVEEENHEGKLSKTRHTRYCLPDPSSKKEEKRKHYQHQLKIHSEKYRDAGGWGGLFRCNALSGPKEEKPIKKDRFRSNSSERRTTCDQVEKVEG